MLLTVSLLCIVTFIAGLIDSIAGGGGLLRLPAVLIAGFSPQQALGTNKFVGAIGTGAAMLNFARKGLILWKLAFIGIPCALLGSAAGSKCILAFDPQTAGKILIALLPVAAMITLIPRRSKSCKDSFTPKDVYLLTPLICFSVGFYDGFFGPGAGSFFIIAFNVCLRMNLIQASALTKVFNLSSNLGSLFVFLYHGDVLFLYAIPMTVADVLGNLAGSQLAIRTGPTIVRRFLLPSKPPPISPKDFQLVGRLHERSSFHSSAVRKREKQAREPEQKMFRLPSFVYETRLGSYCPSVPYSLFIYRERGEQGFDEHESLWKGWVWRKVFPSLFPNLRPIFLQTSIPACRRPLRARPQ